MLFFLTGTLQGVLVLVDLCPGKLGYLVQAEGFSLCLLNWLPIVRVGSALVELCLVFGGVFGWLLVEGATERAQRQR